METDMETGMGKEMEAGMETARAKGQELRIGPEVLEAAWERFQFVARREKLGF